MAGTRSGRHLLAASARPRAGVLLASCAIIVGVLGVVFAHQTTADRFDRAVDSPVISWFDAHRGLAVWLAYPGTTVPAAALSGAMIIACLLTGRLRGAVLAATAVPVAVGTSEVLLKPLVHRTYLGQVVYPSGHVAVVFALAGTLTVLLLAPPRPSRAVRVPVLTAAYLIAGAVVAAVIGMRFHYFTDTVAGAAVGTGTVCALALLLAGLLRKPAGSWLDTTRGKTGGRSRDDRQPRVFRRQPCHPVTARRPGKPTATAPAPRPAI